MHKECHSADFARRGGVFAMVQLWINLPAKDKMSAPGYQGIADAQIPRVELPGDAGAVRVIAGAYDAAKGAARTFTPMNVWDLRLNAGSTLSFDLVAGHTAALFVLHGMIRIGAHTVRPAELAVLEREGSELAFDTTEDAVVLLLSGQPLAEPIVGHGPFVMNSRDEIVQAMRDFESGNFGQIAR